MINLRTIALLVAVIIMATACKDDDETADHPSESLTEDVQRKMQDREAAATLLSTLTGETFSPMDDIDIEGKAYEPGYGEVGDEAQPFCRTVVVRSAAEAEAAFLMLVGGNERLVSETSDGYRIDMTSLDCHSTGKRQNLGTLTFHREDGRNDMGYAEVSIGCMPHLQQIAYKTREQTGKNSAFTSPCGYGDVYVNKGKYYICVKESEGYTSNAAGKLVAMESGRGSGWRLVSDYEDDLRGLWLPEQVGTAYDITLFLLLCSDEDFLPQKKRITKKYPGLVFPYARQYRNGLSQSPTITSAADEGFGTTQRGYSHYVDWGIDDSQDLGSGILVARDASIGSYVGLFQGWWRMLHFVKFSPRTLRDKDVRERTYSFSKSQLTQFNNFLAGFDAIYTCTVVSFNEKKPDGFSLVDI